MELISRLEHEIQTLQNGERSNLERIILEICDTNLDENSRSKIAEALQKNYAILRANFATPVVFLLGKIDAQKAVEIAQEDINKSYLEFRKIASHLHALTSTILFARGIIVSSSDMESERNMRLAYAIINNLPIINGDFFLKNDEADNGHDELVKKLAPMPDIS